jgi:hypothetical protein
MGFFMNGNWDDWCQSDYVNIDENGILDIDYKINKVLADKKLDGTGALGMMGVMILNMPEEGYPYEVSVLEADFTADDGTVTEFDSVKAITEGTRHPESGWRIIIRPEDDPDNPDVKATPEVKGWNEPGAFEGGTLHIKIDMGAPEPPAKKDDSSNTESKADDSSKSGDSGSGSSGSGNSGSGSSGSSTTTTSSASDASSESDTSSAAEESASDTTTTTTGDTAKSDDASSATDVKSSESKTDSSSKTETTTTTTTTTTNTTTTTADTGTGVKIASADELGTSSESASDATQASDTGIGGTLAFGLGALALAGIVVSRKK